MSHLDFNKTKAYSFLNINSRLKSHRNAPGNFYKRLLKVYKFQTSAHYSSTKGENLDVVQWWKRSKISLFYTHLLDGGGKFTALDRHGLCRSRVISPTNRLEVESAFINISISVFCWAQSPPSLLWSSLLVEELSPSAGHCPSSFWEPSSWALNSIRACLFDSISSCSLPLSESLRSSRSSR